MRTFDVYVMPVWTRCWTNYSFTDGDMCDVNNIYQTEGDKFPHHGNTFYVVLTLDVLRF